MAFLSREARRKSVEIVQVSHPANKEEEEGATSRQSSRVFPLRHPHSAQTPAFLFHRTLRL